MQLTTYAGQWPASTRVSTIRTMVVIAATSMAQITTSQPASMERPVAVSLAMDITIRMRREVSLDNMQTLRTPIPTTLTREMPE